MEKIIILDFGSQYTHLIARRVRQLGIYSEIHSSDYDISKSQDVIGIILSGGPNSVYEKDSPKANPKLRETNIPILGLCYGHQLIAKHYGSEVISGNTKEYGTANLVTKNHNIFDGLEQNQKIRMSHGDEVVKLAEGFENIASTLDCQIAGFANDHKKRYGLQFHPEVTHTENGIKMLENFITKICKVNKNWTKKNYIQKIIEDIKIKVGNKNVFMLVSGGVDSTVAFALINKALGGERCYGLFIDNGLMRYEEGNFVKNSIEKLGYKNFHTYDASEYFLKKLNQIYEPEQKRKIIGEAFIEIQQEVLKNLNLDPEIWLLGQGTIYPDIIESQGTKHASLIKTHHNRIPFIQKMIEEGKVIEPLMDLYKDEVREVGIDLGLPKELIFRHPFPGPGLGIRVLCSGENTKDTKVKILESEKEKFFILPIQSVGAQGDARTYKHPLLLIQKENWENLEKKSTMMTNKFTDINRCLLLLGNKEKIENMKLSNNKFLSSNRINLLRKIDHDVNSILQESGYREKIWQVPIVLAPFGISGESIILRPINSSEAMTATFAHLPYEIWENISQKILSYTEIDCVMFDITNKPPGTIERE